MPAYSSAYNVNEEKLDHAAGCAILPVKRSRGPAPPMPADSGDVDDIVDEAIAFFRANVLFKTFEVKGGADRVLVYLTLFIQLCLKKVQQARCKNKAEAMSVLQSLGLASSFCMPGDADWPLSSLMALPSAPEKSKLQAYLRQLRAETVNRLAVEGRMFNADGSLNKWWLSFAKRSFMNKNLPS